MNGQTRRGTVAGPAGPLEIAEDLPAGAPQGLVVVCHPHPQFGGTLDNKVVQTLARAFLQLGWRVVRFNFRGVGGSAGGWDEGRGEIDDALAVIAAVRRPGEPLRLAGFSFGAFVASCTIDKLWTTRDIRQLVLVGTAASRFSVAALPPESHERALIVHGEQDDTVPLAAVMDWARPQSLPVTVVPGGGHFFHGQLPLLKSLVVRHLRAG